METTLLDLHKRFGTQLYDIICKKLQHQDHCNDIMQNVFLKIMLNLPKIESATNTAGYLVRLTNNAIIDHYRGPKLLVEDAMNDHSDSQAHLEQDQSLQLADCCLRPMIDTLPDIYRQALIMTELEGRKISAYAANAAISLSNAKVRVQRAKEKLKYIILQCCTYQFDKYGNIVTCQKNPQSLCCNK
jgi:RNA polymerase sigma-70 factor (ECF subfamily)